MDGTFTFLFEPAAAALVSALVLSLLAGCYTVEGVGKDVKATGQAVEKAADQNKRY